MGEHHCLYYHSLEDLCSAVAGFLKDGIRKNMLCLWVVPEGLGVEAAKAALREMMANLDPYVETGQLEIREFHDWYTPSGVFNVQETLDACAQKGRQALERGFSTLCAVGDGSWLLKNDREKLIAYENAVKKAISQSKISALCTYAAEKLDPEEMRIFSGYHDVTLSNCCGTLAIFN